MNKKIFASSGKKSSFVAAPVDSTNEAGGKAYNRPDAEKLATIVMTGFFGDTYYVSAESQVDDIIKLCKSVDTKFIAQLAVEAREHGYMKDSPALLCAILTTRGEEGRNYLRRIFNRVIDNGKMLRNFVQILRSGKVGRKSLGTAPKNLVRAWFNQHNDESVFRNSVGNDPSMGDVIKMVHPRADSVERNSLYAYLIGKETKGEVPAIISTFEAIKASGDVLDRNLKNIPMEMLTGLPNLSEKSWQEIAKNMSWTQLRMNLNTLARHGVFKNTKLTNEIAAKLRDPELIRKTKVYPYQIFTTLINIGQDVPEILHRALADALDISLENIPDIDGKTVYVFPDVSGSMGSAVTGNRGTATTKMRYVDVAALFAAAMARKGATVWAIDTQLHKLGNKPSDSVAKMAKDLSACGGGGTSLSIPMAELNSIGAKPDLIVYFSDNESWLDDRGASYYWNGNSGTRMSTEFAKLKKRAPNAKLVLVDMAPTQTSQVNDHKDVLKVAGFSDRVFDVVNDFLTGKDGKSFWVRKIESVEI